MCGRSQAIFFLITLAGAPATIVLLGKLPFTILPKPTTLPLPMEVPCKIVDL